MKNREVSAKALTTWIACGMLGPLALTAARSAWPAVLVTGMLCALLCATIHGFSDGRIWENRVYCGILLLWDIYACALVAYQGSICWPDQASGIAVPLTLLALAALSAWNGGERASRITATLCPLCVLIFAIVLASGVGNIRWNRVGFSTASPGGTLLFVFLLPVAATAIPRKPGAAVARCLWGLTVFAGILSVAVCGTLSVPVALMRTDSFYEFSKSLNLFSTVQRFESVTAVAVTLSIYAMLSLLLSGIGHLGERILPGSGRKAVLAAGALSGGLLVWELFLDPKVLAVLSLTIWGVAPSVVQFLPCGKKSEKDENTP